MAESDIEITIDSADAQWIANVFGSNKLHSVIKRGMASGLRVVQGKLPDYPPPPAPGWWAAHTTRAMQRAFFAKLHSGGWAKRTGTLGKSITTDVQDDADGVTGRIGTNVSKQTAASGYAEFVVGRDTQARMHAGRWWLLQDEVEKHTDDIEGAIGDEIDKFVESGNG